MNADDEDRFARIAYDLELDLASDTRDLGPLARRSRPRPELVAGGGVALLLGHAELPTTPWLYGLGVLVALTYLTQLIRATAHDWSHHSDSETNEHEAEDDT